MNGRTTLLLALISGPGMVLVAVLAAVYWRRVTCLSFNWLWVGAGVWAVGVAVKLILAVLTNAAVLKYAKAHLSYALFIVAGGAWLGIQSSVCEMGVTLMAGRIWPRLGQDADRATGVGVGAGAFEAILLGISSFIGVLVLLKGLPNTEEARESVIAVAAVTPLFWLAAPVERVIAILCHTSCRALVLLGSTRRRGLMVFGGFLIFALLDGVAGAAHVSGRLGKFSMWWLELAILPFALISIPIIRWCYAQWAARPGDGAPVGQGNPPDATADVG